MKVITTVKMPQKEKDAVKYWLEQMFDIGLPCEGIKCSGIRCDECPLNKISQLKTDLYTATEELLASIEVEKNE